MSEYKPQQQIALVSVGIQDMARSRRFYDEGFGWKPVFELPDIAFYQMNGLMLGMALLPAFDADIGQTMSPNGGAYAFAHNVPQKEDVVPLMERLVAHGGKIIRPADAPAHGGFRGYIADPDQHLWEIAFNPTWAISPEGHVTFGL